MRGPTEDSATATGSVTEGEEQTPRVPGGKVLLRLLQILESDGLTDIADEVVHSAVPEADVADVMEIASQAGILAPERGRGDTQRTTSRGRATRARRTTAAAR